MPEGPNLYRFFTVSLCQLEVQRLDWGTKVFDEAPHPAVRLPSRIPLWPKSWSSTMVVRFSISYRPIDDCTGVGRSTWRAEPGRVGLRRARSYVCIHAADCEVMSMGSGEQIPLCTTTADQFVVSYHLEQPFLFSVAITGARSCCGIKNPTGPDRDFRRVWRRKIGIRK
jgi:hypothetical protein